MVNIPWDELFFVTPSGTSGGAEVSGKVALPEIGNFEPCGRAYHQHQFPQSTVGDVDMDSEMLMEGPEMDALRAKLHKKNLDLEDYYALLALEEYGVDATDSQIRANFKKISLICHPDKATPAERSYAEKRFKAIQKAFDTLTTKIKKIGYDSQLPFDESIPGEKEGDSEATFFQVYAPVFQRNGRFSMVKPVPQLGDMQTSYEQVNSFYDFWFGFKSWRDFTYLDEHKPDDSTGRDEKRHMERQNQKLRAGKKKEETARVRKMVEMAMEKDPRVKLQRLEEEKQKALKKVEQKARAKQKAEEEAAFALAVKKKQAEAEENAIREKEEFKRKQEEAKKLRTTFKRLCKTGGFDPDAVQTVATGTSIEKLQELVAALTFKPETPPSEEELAAGRALFDAELAQRQAEQQAAKVIKKAKDDEVAKTTSATQAFDLYQAKVLKKKVDLEGRSAVLGEAGGGPRFEQAKPKDTEVSVQDCIKFAKKAEEFLAAAFGDQALKFTDEERKGGSLAQPLPDLVDFGIGVEEPAPAAVVVHAVETWNAEQQAAFEAALKSTPKEVDDRWEVIASKVPGKTKKDCVKRFKEIREKIMAAKAK